MQSKHLMAEVDSNDEYERRDTLIMSGPSLPLSSATENSKLVIHTLLREHLQLNINPDDISVAHRLGKKPQASPDRRNIIFKLCRRDLASEILNACKQFRNSNGRQPLYINESLTPLRSKVFYGLRLLKRKFPAIIKSCRSQTGNITAFTQT